MGAEETIERLTYEACEYGVEQNIRIFELRYSPGLYPRRQSPLELRKDPRGCCPGCCAGKVPGHAVGLIGIVQKTLSLRDAAYTTDFIIDNSSGQTNCTATAARRVAPRACPPAFAGAGSAGCKQGDGRNEHKASFVGIDMADMDIGFGIRRFAPLMVKGEASACTSPCIRGKKTCRRRRNMSVSPLKNWARKELATAYTLSATLT